MLENDLTGVIDTTFSVEHDSFGVMKVHDLKKNGRNIQVTEQNKKEWCGGSISESDGLSDGPSGSL